MWVEYTKNSASIKLVPCNILKNYSQTSVLIFSQTLLLLKKCLSKNSVLNARIYDDITWYIQRFSIIHNVLFDFNPRLTVMTIVVEVIIWKYWHASRFWRGNAYNFLAFAKRWLLIYYDVWRVSGEMTQHSASFIHWFSQ